MGRNAGAGGPGPRLQRPAVPGGWEPSWSLSRPGLLGSVPGPGRGQEGSAARLCPGAHAGLTGTGPCLAPALFTQAVPLFVGVSGWKGAHSPSVIGPAQQARCLLLMQTWARPGPVLGRLPEHPEHPAQARHQGSEGGCAASGSGCGSHCGARPSPRSAHCTCRVIAGGASVLGRPSGPGPVPAGEAVPPLSLSASQSGSSPYTRPPLQPSVLFRGGPTRRAACSVETPRALALWASCLLGGS